MSATLVIAILIASASTFEAALPFDGAYQTHEFANSEQGIDDLVAWISTSGHDKIDMYCVAILDAEGSPAAQFWRESPAERLFFVNPHQIKRYSTERGVAPNARTLAGHCSEIFQKVR